MLSSIYTPRHALFILDAVKRGRKGVVGYGIMCDARAVSVSAQSKSMFSGLSKSEFQEDLEEHANFSFLE